MRPADTQPAVASKDDQPEKKTRTVTELPTSIDDGTGHVILADLSLAELADYQQRWKQKLADIPRLQLELRAINQAIRKCASGR